MKDRIADLLLKRLRPESHTIYFSSEYPEDLEKVKSLFKYDVSVLKLGQIVEGGKSYKVGPHSMRIDPSHGYKGQLHLHYKNMSVNFDGSSHDGSGGKRLPNQVADFARSKGFNIDKENIIRGSVNESFDGFYVFEMEIVLSD